MVDTYKQTIDEKADKVSREKVKTVVLNHLKVTYIPEAYFELTTIDKIVDEVLDSYNIFLDEYDRDANLYDIIEQKMLDEESHYAEQDDRPIEFFYEDMEEFWPHFIKLEEFREAYGM